MVNPRGDLNFGVMIRSSGNKSAKVQECRRRLAFQETVRMKFVVIPVAQWYPEKRR